MSEINMNDLDKIEDGMEWAKAFRVLTEQQIRKVLETVEEKGEGAGVVTVDGVQYVNAAAIGILSAALNKQATELSLFAMLGDEKARIEMQNTSKIMTLLDVLWCIAEGKTVN